MPFRFLAYLFHIELNLIAAQPCRFSSAFGTSVLCLFFSVPCASAPCHAIANHLKAPLCFAVSVRFIASRILFYALRSFAKQRRFQSIHCCATPLRILSRLRSSVSSKENQAQRLSMHRFAVPLLFCASFIGSFPYQSSLAPLSSDSRRFHLITASSLP